MFSGTAGQAVTAHGADITVMHSDICAGRACCASAGRCRLENREMSFVPWFLGGVVLCRFDHVAGAQLACRVAVG